MAAVSAKDRIWELDFARGVAIILVCIVHMLVILPSRLGDAASDNAFFIFVKQYGGVFFLVLSGVCAGFSHHSFKRGMIVFACGIAVSAVSIWLYQSMIGDSGCMIRWGVLSLTGLSMMLYPLMKKIPVPLLAVLAAAVIIIGYYWKFNVTVDSQYLFPLGLAPKGLREWDWWPVFPNMGWFMAGVCLRPLLYKEKKTLFPGVRTDKGFLSFLCLCGRHSLEIYLVHLGLLVLIKYFVL